MLFFRSTINTEWYLPQKWHYFVFFSHKICRASLGYLSLQLSISDTIPKFWRIFSVCDVKALSTEVWAAWYLPSNCCETASALVHISPRRASKNPQNISTRKSTKNGLYCGFSLSKFFTMQNLDKKSSNIYIFHLLILLF